MAFAHAMLKADDRGDSRGMQSFKESNGADATTVGIGVDGLSAAEPVYDAGGSVDFEGASGRVVFDDTGDRLELGIRTFSPSLQDGTWGWAY